MDSYIESIRFSNGVKYGMKQPPADPTAGMVCYRVKNDTESPFWEFKPRPVAPDPAVNPTSGSKNTWPDTTRSWFTAAWQWFLVDTMALQKYGKVFKDLPDRGSEVKNVERNLIISAFNDFTAGNKAMFDGHGTEKYNNYITEETDRGEDPKQQSKITATNLVYSRWPVEKNFKGVEMVRLDSFLASKGPPEATLQVLKDHRMHKQLIIYSNGTLGNFPHLKGVPLLCPFVTVGEAWYRRDELILIG